MQKQNHLIEHCTISNTSRIELSAQCHQCENGLRINNKLWFYFFQKYIEESIEAQKALEIPEQPTKPRQSFGVLDRFVSNPKSKK